MCSWLAVDRSDLINVESQTTYKYFNRYLSFADLGAVNNVANQNFGQPKKEVKLLWWFGGFCIADEWHWIL